MLSTIFTSTPFIAAIAAAIGSLIGIAIMYIASVNRRDDDADRLDFLANYGMGLQTVVMSGDSYWVVCDAAGMHFGNTSDNPREAIDSAMAGGVPVDHYYPVS